MKTENLHYVTSSEAAKLLGYTIQHTRLLFRQNKLPAQKVGRDWLIPESTFLEFVKIHKKMKTRCHMETQV